MRKLWLLIVCCLAAAQAQPASRTTAVEQLGYPAGTKLLILHADDLAVTHSADSASFAALEQQAVSSASIMVPCPWLTEVAAYARTHAEADLGLHLTLTAEWKNYRWGTVARGPLNGLLDSDGYFWPDAASVARHATAAEVETELRAQVDRAIGLGIHPTHLDSHMGTLFDPRFFSVYAKIAREYRLPFLLPRFVMSSPALRGEVQSADILVDTIVVAGPSVQPGDWTAFYVRTVQSLKPGLTEIIVHLSGDDVESAAVMGADAAFGSAWRRRDFDAVTSSTFRKALDDNHVTVIGWRTIQQHWSGAR